MSGYVSIERSTVAVAAAFFDEEDVAITPKSIVWTLTDGAGVVVNSREDVSVAPANSIVVVLSGDDCAMQSEGDDGRRQVIISAVYDGDLGDDLDIVGVFEFTIRNISGKA